MSLPGQQHNWYERLLNVISVVRPGEGRSCMLLTTNIALLMAAFYLLKVIREPLILAYGGAEYKGYATAIQAAVLMLLVPLFTLFFKRYGQHTSRAGILKSVVAFFVVNLLIFATLHLQQVQIAFVFYVWLGLFGVLVLAQFWAFAADCYNVRAGQRLFVVLAVGATFGSWAGAQTAGWVFASVGITGILLLSATLLLLVFVTANRVCDDIPASAVNKDGDSEQRPDIRWLDGFSLVLTNPYLLKVAALVVVLVFINSSGEYILASFVNQYTQAQEVTDPLLDGQQWQSQFYANYYSWITLLSFALQVLVVSRVFKWLKIKGAILILPLIMITGYGLLLIFPVFVFARWLLTSENAVHYSLQNTLHQALFLPVSRRDKYLSKTTIDTFFFRIGDLLFGAVVLMVNSLAMNIQVMIATNLLMALLLFILAWQVGKQNERQVQQKLGNTPPRLHAHLPQLSMPAGQLSAFSISESTFVDPDIGDALTFHAMQQSGQPLPSWISFDRMTRNFTFDPPHQFSGRLEIDVVAKDFEGMTAKASLRVNFYLPEDKCNDSSN